MLEGVSFDALSRPSQSHTREGAHLERAPPRAASLGGRARSVPRPRDEAEDARRERGRQRGARQLGAPRGRRGAVLPPPAGAEACPGVAPCGRASEREEDLHARHRQQPRAIQVRGGWDGPRTSPARRGQHAAAADKPASGAVRVAARHRTGRGAGGREAPCCESLRDVCAHLMSSGLV